MNPCGKLSLFQGARYVAIADFIYATLTAAFIIFSLINTFKYNEQRINNRTFALSATFMPQVLEMYLGLSLLNMVLAMVLYLGITTNNLLKCRAVLSISVLSTVLGVGTLIFHGCHLNDLNESVVNSEFFISVGYHFYKLYALLVIFAFTHELSKLLSSDAEADAAKKKRLRYQSLDSSNGEEGEGERVKHIFFGIPFSDKHFVPQERFRIDYDACVEFDEATSTVRGVLQVNHHDPAYRREVVIKILKSNFRTEKHMTELVKEAKLMFMMGNHEHIIKLLAVHCEVPPEDMSKRGNVMLIMEDYPARRLDDFLRKSFENRLQNFQNLLGPQSYLTDKRSKRMGTLYENLEAIYTHQLEPFSTLNMIQWAYQLSSAMDFLHTKEIVFGNLQAKSLILEKASKLKISNFGLASELHEQNNTITSIYLPGKVCWRWTALECLISTNQGQPTQFTEKTDVWSYGSTLWEIFSMGHTPNVSSSLSEYISALEKGKRAEKPEFASDGIHNLMKTCWSQNPADRPGFNVISLFFRQLLSRSIHSNWS